MGFELRLGVEARRAYCSSLMNVIVLIEIRTRLPVTSICYAWSTSSVYSTLLPIDSGDAAELEEHQIMLVAKSPYSMDYKSCRCGCSHRITPANITTWEKPSMLFVSQIFVTVTFMVYVLFSATCFSSTRVVYPVGQASGSSILLVEKF